MSRPTGAIFGASNLAIDVAFINAHYLRNFGRKLFLTMTTTVVSLAFNRDKLSRLTAVHLIAHNLSSGDMSCLLSQAKIGPREVLVDLHKLGAEERRLRLAFCPLTVAPYGSSAAVQRPSTFTPAASSARSSISGKGGWMFGAKNQQSGRAIANVHGLGRRWEKFASGSGAEINLH